MTKTARIFTIFNSKNTLPRDTPHFSQHLGGLVHTRAGRDADRRKKTGSRRWIEIKEHLVAEDRKRMSVSGELLCRAQTPSLATHSQPHAYHNHCLHHQNYRVSFYLPLDGRGQGHIRVFDPKIPARASRLFYFSLVEMPTEERRLVEEEGSQTKKTWLQKREDQEEQASSCSGPCSPFW